MASVSLKGLARGTGWAGLLQFWRMASSLVLTPLILAYLGIEGFGVWVLLLTLANSVQLMNVSFGSAYAKLTAEHEERREYAELSRLVSSGVALVGGVAALALGAVWIARVPLLRAVNVDEPMLAEAGDALVLVTLGVALMLSAGCVHQVLAGLQRTDLRFQAHLVSAFVYLVGAVALLNAGFGLVGLASAQLAGEVVGTALSWWRCRRLCPQLRISPFAATRAGMGQMISLGGRFQVLFLLNFAVNHGFRLVLSALMGPAVLGVFVIGKRLINFAQTAAGAIQAPMMPAFAKLYSAGEQDRARTIHDRGSRAMYAAVLFSVGFLAVFAEDAILLWTADTYPRAAWTLRALAVAFAFKQLSGMGTSSLRGQGKFRLEFATALFSLTLRTALVFPLWWIWSFEGFVLSETITHIAATLVFLAWFSRLEGWSMGRFLVATLARPTLAIAPCIALVAIAADRVDVVPELLSGRWAAALQLGFWGAVYSVLCALSMWTLGLDDRERDAVATLARRVRGRGARSSPSESAPDSPDSQV